MQDTPVKFQVRTHKGTPHYPDCQRVQFFFGRKPPGLDGKNWRELRQKRRMGHEKWQPTKRLTWYQIEHLKTLRKTQPEKWSVKQLADSFGISTSAVSRILKSRFEPSDETKERQDVMATEQARKRKEEFLQKLSIKREVELNNCLEEQTKRKKEEGSEHLYRDTEMESIDDKKGI